MIQAGLPRAVGGEPSLSLLCPAQNTGYWTLSLGRIALDPVHLLNSDTHHDPRLACPGSFSIRVRFKTIRPGTTSEPIRFANRPAGPSSLGLTDPKALHSADMIHDGRRTMKALAAAAGIDASDSVIDRVTAATAFGAMKAKAGDFAPVAGTGY